MASLFQAYKVWDSNDGFNATSTVLRTLTGINPRPAQLQPQTGMNGEIQYNLVDNITSATYPDVNGAKAISGIVTEDTEGQGVLTFWDISGTGITGIAYTPTTDTPNDKMTNIVYALNNQCLDCTGSTQVIAGQFENATNYPSFTATTYCYKVVVTGDGQTTLARRQLQTYVGEYRIGEITMYPDTANDLTTTTYKVCLSNTIASIGIPATISAVTANGGTIIYGMTWTLL